MRGLPPASLNLIALLIEIAETPLPRASWHLAVLAPPPRAKVNGLELGNPSRVMHFTSSSCYIRIAIL
jgi:hypothetical protein